MRRRGFTLIELLVVIAIIAILATILFPVFASAKLAAKQTRVLSNMKQLTVGLTIYLNDADDTLLPASDRTDAVTPAVWPPRLLPYVKNEEIFVAVDSQGSFARDWSTRMFQTVGYSDATGVDPASISVPGAASAGTEGFASAMSAGGMEEVARSPLFAVTPGGTGKRRGYVFNPYNGPNNGVYAEGLPLIADVDLTTTPYRGVDYSTRSPGLLKPIFARYGGSANGVGTGRTPIGFADGHAKSESANALNVPGRYLWRFR